MDFSAGASGIMYFRRFYSLLFQIKGLIGPRRHSARAAIPRRRRARPRCATRFWYRAVALLDIRQFPDADGGRGRRALASLCAIVNLWPRLSFLVCFVCFLSFVTATNVFSNYQSDGMLLEAGFLSLVLCPGGLLPGWGANSPPPRASLFLLQWEWFRIYFESGMVKLLSGDGSGAT